MYSAYNDWSHLMKRAIASIKRHPLATFVGLTFVCSWWAWPLYAAGSLPIPIFAAGLFLTGQIQWPDVVSIIGGYMLYAWIYNRSGGSILLLMLAHTTNNTISGGLVSQMFEGADRVQQGLSLAIVWVAAALGVALLTGTDLGRRPVERREALTTPISVG
jgi:hypothetical protein